MAGTFGYPHIVLTGYLYIDLRPPGVTSLVGSVEPNRKRNIHTFPAQWAAQRERACLI